MKSSSVSKCASVSPGNADDEGRPQGDAGNAGADARDEVADVLAAGLAAHAGEQIVVDVLQRHVHVARDLLARGDSGDQLVGPVRRVRVEQADPEVALERVQLAQQRAERRGVGGEGLGGGGELLRARRWRGNGSGAGRGRNRSSPARSG
jgi:hypothetical protein